VIQKIDRMLGATAISKLKNDEVPQLGSRQAGTVEWWQRIAELLAIGQLQSVRAVAEFVFARAEVLWRNPDLSLGVATFSVRQRDLIEPVGDKEARGSRSRRLYELSQRPRFSSSTWKMCKAANGTQLSSRLATDAHR
jgi:hypothetical protein